MTTTPLPSYGIWTTDEDGNRVMGFTPEQFLSVWQSRADLEAENARLREALHRISLCSQNSMSSQHECGKIARAALENKP